MALTHHYCQFLPQLKTNDFGDVSLVCRCGLLCIWWVSGRGKHLVYWRWWLYSSANMQLWHFFGRNSSL